MASPPLKYFRTLICLILFPLASFLFAEGNLPAPEKISIKTKDGHTLVGSYRPAKRGFPTVVMLHGLQARKEEWNPLISILAESEIGVLNYDARGHGESSKTINKKGNPDGFLSFGPPRPGSPWERMIDDVGLFIRFLIEEKKVNRSRIILAGASMGANVSLNYVALTQPLGGLLLLSPGMQYIGLSTGKFIQEIKTTPVVMVASHSDVYAFDSSKKLNELNPRTRLWTDVKGGHGVQMLEDFLLKRILTWVTDPK